MADEVNNDARMSEREERRRVRRQEERRANGGQPTGQPDPRPTPDEVDYTYRDPGRFGAPGYSYQVGDEMSNPGPEPPRDDPRWPEWKAAARAWRNFIGGRQRYVDENVGIYGEGALEAMGIRDQKEEGRAGYRRIMAPGMIDTLRQRQADWMKNSSDAEIDPTTGLYVTGQEGNFAYYDAYGRSVDANGRPTNGAYGQGHMQATFGAGAGPLNVGANGYNAVRPGPRGAGRPTTPTPAGPPQMQYGPNWKEMTQGPRTGPSPYPAGPTPAPTPSPTADTAAWGGYKPMAANTATARPAATPQYQPQSTTANAMGAPGQRRPTNQYNIRGGQIQTGLPRF